MCVRFGSGLRLEPRLGLRLTVLRGEDEHGIRLMRRLVLLHLDFNAKGMDFEAIQCPVNNY